MRLLLIFVAGLFFLLGLDPITYALQEKNIRQHNIMYLTKQKMRPNRRIVKSTK